MALLCVWTCSGVDDEFWYELDAVDSSIGGFIASVISLIWGIPGKDAMAKCQSQQIALQDYWGSKYQESQTTGSTKLC